MSTRAGEPALPGIEGQSGPLTAELESAFRAKGPAYVARTRHKDEAGKPRFINRLINETSPYLLQHAHNPVNWRPWGDEAFIRAKSDGKLVLLSVGYATCHWCHVMEHESFEDEEIAAYINQNFVPVKVDREERPDVDAVYMTAVQLMTGHGGWPMTVFLTDDRRPIYGGTYFPPRDGARGARFGFLTLLRELRRRQREAPELVAQAGERLVAHMHELSTAGPPGAVPGAEAIVTAVQALVRGFDEQWGGFGDAPKFPRSATLELLMRYARRTGDEDARRAVRVTLERMAEGGIYDQVGGGFHRYSVDDEWLVPHFEKMLYDNAQLAMTYLEAWQLFGRDDFAKITHDTLSYLQREMTTRDGGLYAATDADSLGPDGHVDEGYFFTWTKDELERVVGARHLKLAAAYYGVTAHGNFEGRTVLSARRPLSVVAAEQGLSPREAEQMLLEARDAMYRARAVRPPPLTDRKIVTAWNALAISAFARAGFAFGAPSYLLAAEAAADFVLGRMRQGERLVRTFAEGQARHPGMLDDYAYIVAALVDLYEATFAPRWLEAALELQGVLDARFWDEEGGGYFFTPHDHEALLLRDKPDYDGAEPAGNSVAALSLLRLAELTGRHELRAKAERLFAAFGEAMRRRGIALPKMLSALDFYLDQPLELVIVASPEGDEVEALVGPLRKSFAPNRVVALAMEGDDLAAQARLVPMLDGRCAEGGKATAYICRGQVCELPTTDAGAVSRALRETVAY
jgi:uncharacterized protein